MRRRHFAFRGRTSQGIAGGLLDRILPLAFGLVLGAGCPAPASAPPPRREPARPPAPEVDCRAHCGRLYLCFSDFLVAADPGAREKIARLKTAGVFERIRQTAHGACRNECLRAGYTGAAAGVINACLRTTGCPGFAACLMDRIYRVDCAALCRRTFGTCLEASLYTLRGHTPASVERLRSGGGLATLGAEEARTCLAECQVRDGHGPNALGLNLCLARPGCEGFAACLRGLGGLAPGPRAPGRRPRPGPPRTK